MWSLGAADANRDTQVMTSSSDPIHAIEEEAGEWRPADLTTIARKWLWKLKMRLNVELFAGRLRKSYLTVDIAAWQ